MTAVNTAAAAQQSHGADSVKRRSAMIGAYQGFFVDFIDIYLPIVALAPALAYFEPKGLSPALSSTLYFVTFASTLLGRPVGALLFGSLSDRIGRRRITMVSVGGFSLCTLLIASLPGYANVGLWAIVLLIGLRFLDGIFLGGEYTAATPLAFEYCRKEMRGLFGGILQGAYCLAFIVISLVTLLVLRFAPAGDVTSAYSVWGWRIPFVFGALLGFAFLIYRRRHLPESELWQKSEKAKAPLREILFGQQKRAFWQVFTLMSGFWLTSQMVTSFVPDALRSRYQVDASTLSWTLLVSNVVLYAGFIAAGVASQRFGRRKFMAFMGAWILIVGEVAFFIFMSGKITSTIGVLLAAILVQLIIVSIWGVATPYVNERFGTSVRSSGFALGYSLSVVIPSFYSFYLLGLGKIMPGQYAGMPLIFLGAILIIVGALWGPETKDLDFRASGHVEPADV
jgi:MFS family permease